MSNGPTFKERLKAAVVAARGVLSAGTPGMDMTDDRARAYLGIASVLYREGMATNDARYINAARQLQEQAEITTYSGFNGTAAIAGNLNALLQNPGLYKVSLDKFSWDIDSRVVAFFEDIVESGRIEEISSGNILAADSLVWDGYGMLAG